MNAGVRQNILAELLTAMDGADLNTNSLQGSSLLGNKLQHFEVIILFSFNFISVYWLTLR